MSSKFRCIVVGYDGSDCSKKALEMAASVAGEEPKSEISIVSVLAPSVMYYPAIANPENVEKERKERAARMLKEAEEHLGPGHAVKQVELLQGNPAKEIVRYAEDNGCDLIVVGSRGLSGIKEFYLGSTSHNVAQKAKMPVLIVK
ncbi:universal stress protein [Indiicoccus explosivorum]|uniref:universal stress protein n=1 Tax=Indiicoccus explosivorum TaxID=1917864 RepID=UPI0013906C76|nr:universal stress protein [Indiicoccus explosivorum]